jgi:hypothetical protein
MKKKKKEEEEEGHATDGDLDAICRTLNPKTFDFRLLRWMQNLQQSVCEKQSSPATRHGGVWGERMYIVPNHARPRH